MAKEIKKSHETFDLNFIDGENVRWCYNTDQHHAVDKYGNVYDRKGDKLVRKFLKPNRFGYILLGGIYYNGKRMCKYAHTLVAEAFICPQPSPKHQINHINENKADNCVSNIEWVTAKENCQKYHEGQKEKGIKHSRPKWKKKYDIVECDLDWNPVRAFTSIREAGVTIAIEEGTPEKWNSIATQISYMISGKYGSHTVHGRKFKLTDDDKKAYIEKTNKKKLTLDEIELVEKMREAAKKMKEAREQENNQGSKEVLSGGSKTLVIHKLDVNKNNMSTIEVECGPDGRIDLAKI